jgi:hypothetical protein
MPRTAFVPTDDGSERPEDALSLRHDPSSSICADRGHGEPGRLAGLLALITFL